MQNGLTEPWFGNHEKEEPEEVSNMHLNTKWYHEKTEAKANLFQALTYELMILKWLTKQEYKK